MKLVSSSLGFVWGSVPNYGCLPIRGRVPGLPIVLAGWGDPCANLLGSDAVVFWGFWVRCGRVKLVSSSHGYIWGSVPNYGCPSIRGRVPWLPIVFPGWVDPSPNFWGSGAVRCGISSDPFFFFAESPSIVRGGKVPPCAVCVSQSVVEFF